MPFYKVNYMSWFIWSNPWAILLNNSQTMCCKLNKAIYGLKQAPRLWYARLSDFLINIGFKNSFTDASLFVCQKFGYDIWILVYVDNLIVTKDNNVAFENVIKTICSKFKCRDLGFLTSFLDIEVTRQLGGSIMLA